jgi:SNF2 family DNA or RNA helicase
LLEEIGDEQVIIWANFKQEISTLLTTLPGSQAIWSQTRDRDKVVKDFQQGRTQYLIANPASAAHGLTFTNCSYAIYFSLNYSYEYQKQSEDRIHRIGQTKPVTYYYLLAQNTIDTVIYKTLRRKGDLSRQVLDYLHDSNQKRVA